MEPMRNLGRQVVLVTGASSGFGNASARHLQARGYRVYGTVRPSGQMGDGCGGNDPGAFERIPMNVDEDESVRRGVAAVLERESRIDVVVNNAGFGIAGAVEETSPEEAKAQFETNFFGVLRLCRAVLPAMRRQRSGLIVNVSSMAGRIAVPYQGLYSASKFAVEGLTEALSMEVRPFGIKVVLIEPGDFHTAFTAHRRRTRQSDHGSAYADRFERSVHVMEADEIEGGPPERVALLLERIIRARAPRLRYPIGPPVERAALVLKQLLPGRLFEWGLMVYYRVR